MHWEDRFRRLAERQDGLVGHDQLAEIGCDAHHWWRARRSGRWAPSSRRVLRLAGSVCSDSQRARAALLDAGGGGVLHGPSALAWFGLRGFDLSEIHVVRRRGTTNGASELAVVHRLRELRDQDVTVARGLPTVTPLRAIWSESSRYSAPRWHDVGVRRIGRLLDDAHTAGLVTWSALHRSVDDLAASGRAGTRIMRELAADRVPGSSVTESRNEDRFEQVLTSGGAAPMRRQVSVGGADPIGRVDFRDATLPMVAEINSLTFHTTPSDRAADEHRYGALVAAGLSVAVIWEADLWSNRRGVLDAVHGARRAASAGRPIVLHSPGCPWPSPGLVVTSGRPPSARG